MLVSNKRDESKKLLVEGKGDYSREELERVVTVVDTMIETAIEEKKEMPKASSFRREGVAGMSSEIDFIIKNLFYLKLNQHKLAKQCQVNGGLLMHGPPGSGKSYLARAVGNVWKRVDPYLSIRIVRGPELFN